MENIALYTFSNIDLVHQCLLDDTRLNAYRWGIQQAIEKGCRTAIDVGTGSGVLATMAASAGIPKVVAVEVDPYLCDTASRVFRQNNLANRITLIHKDVRKLEQSDLPFTCPADLITMDLLTTGLIDEYQVQAVNALHKNGIVDGNTIFVPFQQTTELSLAYADFNVYGLKFEIVRHIWRQLGEMNPKFQLLSSPVLLNCVNYSTSNPVHFNAIFSLKANTSGLVNAVFLSSRTWIDENIYIGDTVSLNAPVIFPLNEFTVKQGEHVSLEIDYLFGEGFSSFKVIKIN